MIRNFDSSIDDLLKNGFANINVFFREEKLNIIFNEIQRVFLNDRNNRKNENYENNSNSKVEKTAEKIYARSGHYSDNLAHNIFGGPILGKSKVIDEFIKKLFNSPEFKTLIEKIAGKNFKIYTLGYRELTNVTKYLGLHQDSYSMVHFLIPLNDISKNDSATSFVSGSHLSKFPLYNELFSICTKVSNKFFEFCMKKYQCKIGDLGIFLNKTFHGTIIKKNGRKVSSAILIGLSAEGGYRHTPLQPVTMTDYNEDFKSSVGENLYDHMFSKKDLIKVDNKYFTYMKNVPANPKINHINTSTSGRTTATISEITSRERRHLIDKVIFDHHNIRLNTKLVIYYVKFILKIKNLLKKIYFFIKRKFEILHMGRDKKK